MIKNTPPLRTICTWNLLSCICSITCYVLLITFSSRYSMNKKQIPRFAHAVAAAFLTALMHFSRSEDSGAHCGELPEDGRGRDGGEASVSDKQIDRWLDSANMAVRQGVTEQDVDRWLKQKFDGPPRKATQRHENRSRVAKRYDAFKPSETDDTSAKGPANIIVWSAFANLEAEPRRGASDAAPSAAKGRDAAIAAYEGKSELQIMETMRARP